MLRVWVVGWVMLLCLGTAVGCGGQQTTRQAPPTKHDPTGNEGGRLPQGPKGK